MAGDDTSLRREVRSLTEYDETIFTDSELTEVLSLAKQEIRAELLSPSLDFYDPENPSASRALFWLTCLFAKIRAGELAAPEVTIASLRIRQPSSDNPLGIWFSQFNKNLSRIVPDTDGSTTVPMGLINVTRAEGRTYGYDNSTNNTTNATNDDLI